MEREHRSSTLLRTLFSATVSVSAAAVLFVGFVLLPLLGHAQSFDSSTLSGVSPNNPTSLDWGPDGRLYVAEQKGIIRAMTISQSSDGYTVDQTETINLVQQMPNRNDLGESASVNGRQVTGILVAGTSTNPVIYVTSSDPRIGAGHNKGELPIDTNSGIISRLTKTADGWEKMDLVRGLPRSEENHSSNGMELVGNTLYVAQGGHTNSGSPSQLLAYTTEYALSAAILEVDLSAIDNMQTQNENGTHPYKYDLPTLNDPERTDVSSTSGFTDPNDPFGGNDGLNQAKLVENGPVQIYSSGWRNPYDLVMTESGDMYAVDNGANEGWGGWPAGEGSGGSCTNNFDPETSGEVQNLDNLHLVSEGFYAGHPNPVRGNPDGAGLFLYDPSDSTGFVTSSSELPEDWPPVPASMADPAECDFLRPGQEDGALHTWNTSTNGIDEYTGSSFDGAMQGDLLATSFGNYQKDGQLYRIQVGSADQATDVTSIATFPDQAWPLDVVSQGDDGPFPGTIWIAAFAHGSGDNITVLDPSSSGECSGTYSETIDADGDGYSNADEIDNGTDPCSASSTPPDHDGDLVSNLNDGNDDNDGNPNNGQFNDNLDDTADRFALDPDNGLTKDLPVIHPMDKQDESNPETGFSGLGFMGMMNNGSDYLDLVPEDVIYGAVGGNFTLSNVGPGTAYAGNNSLTGGFQFGVNVDQNTAPFTVESTMEGGPFFGGEAEDDRSQGIFVGTGDQDNYVEIALDANGGQGGIRVVHEEGGTVQAEQIYAGGVLPANQITLHLTVDPSAGTVQPAYQKNGGSVTQIGSPLQVTGDLLDAVQGDYTVNGEPSAMAVGVIATSHNSGGTYAATWDNIHVTEEEDDSAPPSSTDGEALVEVTPWGKLNKSTYVGGAFAITNNSDNNVAIDSVTFDLGSAILRDIVFDPDDGSPAGDVTGKCLISDEGGTATGYVMPADNCADPFAVPHENGYDIAGLKFTDFAPGETFKFSADIDPTSIQGYGDTPTDSSAGHVSGLELAGAEVTVWFSDGSVVSSDLFNMTHKGQDSRGDAYTVVKSDLPDQPSLESVDVSTSTTTTESGATVNVGSTQESPQTIRVHGPSGSTVRLLHVDGRMYIEDGTPNGGFDIEQYEANSAVEVLEHQASIGSQGYVDISVDLLKTEAADDGPDGGLNHFMAAIQQDGNDPPPVSKTSDVLVLDYGGTSDGGGDGDYVADVASGWNMLSVPRSSSDQSLGTVYPAADVAYSFDGSYSSTTSLSPGEGYWIYFDQQTSQTISGQEVTSQSLSLAEGWNMIGGISCALEVGAIADPDEILVSGSLTGFDGSYTQTSTIAEGQGYWIQASQAGTITLDCSASGAAKQAAAAQDRRPERSFDRLTVRDRQGRAQTLHFNGDLPAKARAAAYELPPVPPEGTFDVRFDGDRRLVEDRQARIELQASSYPLEVELSAQDPAARYQIELLSEGSVVETRRLSGDRSLEVSDRAVDGLRIGSSARESRPEQFVLEGNYPNPFNPSTTIAFGLPERADVSVEVIDMLGRTVMSLDRQQMSAGRQTITLRADELATGTYIYRVIADMGTNTAMKTGRMMLMK